MRRVAVIGGGAAGMAAAIAAAEGGAAVTVLERGRRVLKKLGVTGNGRGNLLNSGVPEYYGDAAFALRVLNAMPYAELERFFTRLGVPLVEEAEGRMYPAALLASVAVDALCLRAGQLNVRVEANTRVTAIRRVGNGFALEGLRLRYAPDTPRKSGKLKPGALLGEEPMRMEADGVIVAAGGAAAPMHGTDGSAYALMTALGHTLVAPRPALCALLTEEAPIAGLAGQRVRAALTLTDARGAYPRSASGEALFAQDGVSGIAAMQLSRFVTPGCQLSLDMRAGVMGRADGDAAAWLVSLARAREALPLSQWLTGAASPALNAALVRAAGLAPLSREPVGNVLARRPDAPRALTDALCGLRLRVLGTRGFENAQVTAGGLNAAEFDPVTLQSRLCPGLCAAGEILDVDGGCGGYNLMFAFASGLLAGRFQSQAAK
ncbi:MAG: NAD(P)/FAD-dependent oxidoreductase [Clostridiales bacterium]|nr:NAD(P)/FAD-dependent oxidoreductase [Clostridiales bacterium]